MIPDGAKSSGQADKSDGPPSRRFLLFRPSDPDDGKKVVKELKKLKPQDGSAYLLDLVEEWRNADMDGTQKMYDREAIAPTSERGIDELRAKVGNKQFRLIVAIEDDVMYLLHAFTKTKDKDSDKGIKKGASRWKSWDASA